MDFEKGNFDIKSIHYQGIIYLCLTPFNTLNNYSPPYAHFLILQDFMAHLSIHYLWVWNQVANLRYTLQMYIILNLDNLVLPSSKWQTIRPNVQRELSDRSCLGFGIVSRYIFIPSLIVMFTLEPIHQI